MGLNKVKEGSQMYQFINATWNPIKGDCTHNCKYCYQTKINRRFKKQCAPYFDEKELKTNLGSGNFIFVGSGNDMFAKGIPAEWIHKTLDHCRNFDNTYLFQSKNPERFKEFLNKILARDILVTTIETNRYYLDVMKNAPSPYNRAWEMDFRKIGNNNMITIEPIMDFDLLEFIEIIKLCHPKQVNIGADSGSNNLPEPPKEKVLSLITELEKFTVVNQKSNLKRLI
jgi:DNA repair photolyase